MAVGVLRCLKRARYRTGMFLTSAWAVLGCMMCSISGVGGVEQRWCCEWVGGPALEIPVFGRWYRRVLVSVSAVCAAALVVTGLPPEQAWGEDPPVVPSPQVSAPVSPETVEFPSAVVQARATGERVEVTAERTDSSTTWVNLSRVRLSGRAVM